MGVTHDNHTVVIDCGKHQRTQLYKLQLDGKIVNTSTSFASKDVSNFQSLDSIIEHPNGQVFVVNSASHCIYMLSMLISHTFGALEAKEIPRGSLTNHTVWLLTLLKMVMLVTL